jgi:hypothetical protein
MQLNSSSKTFLLIFSPAFIVIVLVFYFTPVPNRITNLGPLISIISLSVSIIFYLYNQSSQRISAIRRASDALIQEIEENKNILDSKRFKKIEYPISTGNAAPKLIRYTNAYLDLEAYSSIVNSGTFTFFSAKTQHKLTHLYGRIRGRNDLLSYVDHFQDLFFLFHDEKDSDKWYKKVERYDLILTEWEADICNLLDDVKILIRNETSKK